jgi:hypothetical protein
MFLLHLSEDWFDPIDEQVRSQVRTMDLSRPSAPERPPGAIHRVSSVRRTSSATSRSARENDCATGPSLCSLSGPDAGQQVAHLKCSHIDWEMDALLSQANRGARFVPTARIGGRTALMPERLTPCPGAAVAAEVAQDRGALMGIFDPGAPQSVGT